MQEKLKILYLCSYYPNDFEDRGIFIKRHAKSTSLNNEVVVISAQGVNSSKDFEIKFNEENGIKEFIIYYNIYVNLNIPGIATLIRFLRFWRGCLKAIDLAYSNESPDLIQVNVAMPIGFFAIWLNLRRRIPYIIVEHSTIYIERKIPFYFFHRIIYFFSKKTISVTEYLGKYLMNRKFIDKYTVIGNSIDTNLFRPARKLENGIFTFLHISSWRNNKGVDEIIKASSEISKGNSFKFKTIIAGGTENISSLIQLKANLGLSDDVVELLPGFIGEKEVLELYGKSNAFILNSYVETFSVVTLESLACGLPVIVPKLEPLLENVDTSRGIISESNNANDIANSMRLMFKIHASFDPEKLHKFVKERYSFKSINEKFNKAYFEIIK